MCNAKGLGLAQFNVSVLFIYTTVKERANIKLLPGKKRTKNIDNLGDFWCLKSLKHCAVFDFGTTWLLRVTVEDDGFRRSVCGLRRCLMVGGVKKVKGQKSRVSVL